MRGDSARGRPEIECWANEHTAAVPRPTCVEYFWSRCNGIAKNLCVPKKLIHRVHAASVLMDDSAETILPTYGEAFDPIGFKALGQAPQGCRGSKRSMRATKARIDQLHARRIDIAQRLATLDAAARWSAARVQTLHSTLDAERRSLARQV